MLPVLARRNGSSVLAPETQNAFAQIARESFAVTPGETVVRGIFAGWLIAMLVWMRAAVDNGQIPLIMIMTYFVALGGFTHIIAGSIEVLFLVMTGTLAWTAYLTHYMLPVLLGNVRRRLTGRGCESRAGRGGQNPAPSGAGQERAKFA